MQENIEDSHDLKNVKYQSVFAQQREETEETENNMLCDEDLRKVLQTAVSLCVQSRRMSAERAQVFYRSGKNNNKRTLLF